MYRYLTTLLFFMALGYTQAQSINLEESSVKFVADSRLGDVPGQFKGFSGNISFNPNDLDNASFDASILVKTISTNNTYRDEHLRDEDFFDVANYPTIDFKSTQVTKTATGYEVTGELTIKAVTKTVTIPFTYEDEMYEGSLKINRFDFGLSYDSMLNPIGEIIGISILAKTD